MKYKIKRLFLLLIIALVFTLENPAWQWLEALKSHPGIGTRIDLLFNVAETSLAVAAFAIFITLITPPLSRFFLGYESKKPEEGDEVFFFVLLTLFVFSLGLAATHLQAVPHNNAEKDLKNLCSLLSDYDLGRAQQKVDAVCVDDLAKPTADSDNSSK